ncbi:two-component sensor histidine kinase [Jejuia pallidilutea]|uniref:Two-component sensor histidine kinase n=2 Tax=Jejuia pallidilutea TaxID=504487 RepID=A0A090WV55_9FLAO|nr:two-component sensor histidine kinase [Jejuia pallidilutea]
MLSQKLAKDAISLLALKHPEDVFIIKEDLKKTVKLWELSHDALQNGNDSLGLPKQNSKEVIAKFKVLNPIFDSIKDASKSIITKIENVPPLPLDSYVSDIEKVRNHEGDFLIQMDAIVNQYDKEAEEKVAWLGKLELLLMALTLLILLGEFIYIFWPAAKSVRYTLKELLAAEGKAKKNGF